MAGKFVNDSMANLQVVKDGHGYPGMSTTSMENRMVRMARGMQNGWIKWKDHASQTEYV